MVVGAYGDDTGAIDAGSAYVYDLSSMTPTVPIATLNNPTPAPSDLFGNSVAVSGNYVVVGAYLDDTVGPDTGSAYVYDLSSMTPTVPIATLNNPTPAPGDLFGNSVAVSGNYVVVGAYLDDTGAGDAGSAYVYDLSSDDAHGAHRHAEQSHAGRGFDRFGNSVAVSGNYVVVGAYADDTVGPDAGSAYVYDLSSDDAHCAHRHAEQSHAGTERLIWLFGGRVRELRGGRGLSRTIRERWMRARCMFTISRR